MIFLSCVGHFFASVNSCLVATCWKRADLLAFVCDFVTFPCGILGQMWYLIVSIPDFCHLSYFAIVTFYVFTVLFILYLASCLHTIIWHKSGRSLIQPFSLLAYLIAVKPYECAKYVFNDVDS